ncbi:transcription factor SPT20 homolog isoform X2 [Hyposmocoma kahamanoa]|uniref:transcription factor SPT20 homolog isoform X2 n=1 Tax=Hyposmocoma kahamanoa TaxID=1477025 RepID=UPI000E6D6D31|nr:transcription factor SPT20 homolog isoform X2 [Hyposmocoma kahamanoa]
MKYLLTIVSLVICRAWAQPPAPYPPRGWRPNGPTLELPQNVPNAQNPQTNFMIPLDPRNKTPIKQQEYLPPQPDQEYGVPATRDIDLSVQGLPQQEQVQNQQEIYRQLARQRQFEAAQSNNNLNGVPVLQSPRQFARTTPKPQTTFTTTKTEERATTEVTTELNLNEGETLDDNTPKKVTVEVTKQNIQEFHPELYLSPLAQIRLQPQLVPIQFGQLRAYPEQISQKQVAGYDAQTHFAALSSVLAQQQLTQQQLAQQQVQNQPQTIPVQPQTLPLQPQYVPQLQRQNPYLVPQQGVLPQTYQPNQYDQPQMTPQFQMQPVFVQQPTQSEQNDDKEQIQPQFVYQYQQPEYQQPLYTSPQYPQQLILPNQYYQQQVQQNQGQDNLQSGLDVKKNVDDVDQPEEMDMDDGAMATAVATSFGTRTQPRVYTRYGAPEAGVQANPGYQTTTESQDEAVTEDGQANAEATAVARGNRRKSAKLRNRRLRPIFTLDKSGHLVLAQEQ